MQPARAKADAQRSQPVRAGITTAALVCIGAAFARGAFGSGLASSLTSIRREAPAAPVVLPELLARYTTDFACRVSSTTNGFESAV